MMTPTPSGHGIIWRVQSRAVGGGRAPAGTDPVALAQARLANAQAKHAASALRSNARADASKAIKKHTQKLAEAKAAQEAGTVQVRPGRAARRRAWNRTWIPTRISLIPTRG